MSVKYTELTMAITPLERKYDWSLTETDNPGVFELTLDDGAFTASGEIDSLDVLEDKVKDLERKVDEHLYPIIG